MTAEKQTGGASMALKVTAEPMPGRDYAHRIYVASSWRNPFQQHVVHDLRYAGHEVYDFRNPRPGEHGFAWSDIEPDWQEWDARRFRAALDHQVAVDGYASDFDAMTWCDTCVLVLPCGRSAHLELGWAVGHGKRTAILLAGQNEPELMYRMVDKLAVELRELVDWVGAPNNAEAVADGIA